MPCVFWIRITFSIAPLFVLSVYEVEVVNGEERKFGPVHDWPKFERFGQVSAVDVDDAGNVYVFHRGNRRWDYSSFSAENVFLGRGDGPIPNDTVVVLDSIRGSLVTKAGANMFYLPHGLTIDNENNLWVTDVALHQIFKFPPIDLTKNDSLKASVLTLGVKFEPGSDREHFCKPTGVAVDKRTKEFFVADGYCNSRIIKYDPLGNLLLTIGRSSLGSANRGGYMLNVPHAVALGQEEGTLFVADRENKRVTSYSFMSGKFRRSFAEELSSRLFSVVYSPLQGGLLFALTNDNMGTKVVAVYGSTSGKLILTFSPKENFTNPHDLSVSHDGRYCYVVELNPYKVWKFNIDLEIISEVKGGRGRVGEKGEGENSKENLQEPVPAESKIDKTNNLDASSSTLAVGLIVSIIVISFLVFMLHYYSRKGSYRSYESRRLVLDENEGGIQLT